MIRFAIPDPMKLPMIRKMIVNISSFFVYISDSLSLSASLSRDAEW